MTLRELIELAGKSSLDLELVYDDGDGHRYDTFEVLDSNDTELIIS